MCYVVSYGGQIYYGVIISAGDAIFQDGTRVDVKFVDIIREYKGKLDKQYF